MRGGNRRRLPRVLSRYSCRYTRLEDVLVFPVVAERVLAPAGRPAPLSGEVGEGVRQTGRADVRVAREVHRLFHAEHGHVVVQRAGVELPVDDHGDHVHLHVRVELHVVVHVPFAQADAQVLLVVPAERRGKNRKSGSSTSYRRIREILAVLLSSSFVRIYYGVGEHRAVLRGAGQTGQAI